MGKRKRSKTAEIEKMNNCIEVKQGRKMTDKELRKLKKSELLELLLEQNKEVEQLRSQLNKEDDDSLQQSEALQDSCRKNWNVRITIENI